MLKTDYHDKAMDDIPKTPVGRRIKFARERAEVSQSRLGALLNPIKSAASISEIESGKVSPTWDIVLQISEVLGVDVDFFTDKACPECLREYNSPRFVEIEFDKEEITTEEE